MTTLTVLAQRVRRIEKARNASRLAGLSDEELQAGIDADLAIVCEGYPSVSAAADAFRESFDPVDNELAKQLDEYIAQWVRDQRSAIQ